MKRNIFVLIASIIAINIHSANVFASEYLLKYRQKGAISSFSSLRLNTLEHLKPAQLLKIEIDDSILIETLSALASHPNVEYIVPNFRLYAIQPVESYILSDVKDLALRDQWAIKKIKAEEAWKKVGKGSRKVVVALIDTGADYKHKNLSPNMVKGYDFIKKNEDPMDIVSSENPGHGTHCAGIMGATGEMEGGIIGVSPNLSIMPLRFLDENGSGDLGDSIKAIDYAIANKADVISASWGAAVSRSQAAPLIEAMKRAEAAGIVFVVAASNDWKNNDSYEVYSANGGTSNSISVAASNSQDQKPSWSNYGKLKVHLSSPGEKIISTLPSDKYGELSGTSMATPLVAGLVALVKAVDSQLNPVELRALLQASGDRVSINTACDCRVNASSAVQFALEKIPFIAPYAGAMAVGDSMSFHLVYATSSVTYSTTDSNIATIDDRGVLTAKNEGQIQVIATDSQGKQYKSYNVTIGKADSGGGGTPPPSDEECPFQDPQICQIMCQIQPTLPYCK